MANTDDKVMMTYQLPTKDRETVLREDRKALRAMHKHQPHFTEEQKRDLSQVHPWIRTSPLPRALNISACMGCKFPPTIVPATPFDVEIHDMELCSVLETTEKATATQEKAPLLKTAMDQGGEAHREEQQEDVAQTKTQGNDQERTTEEQEVTSLTEEKLPVG
uniref:Period circadian-like C-terminal domain-containing protein n=1 Tax=Hucho hucho TaxID=62062 RepID=A0A4W5LYB4_9TELE